MENRFKTAYSNGNQLYVCIPCLYFRSTVRIRNPDGCSINRRYCGRISGTFAKYWIKVISPIVAATVVTAIGFSLLSVGAASFGGGTGAADFGSANNWILGIVTLVSCILFNILAKGYLKQLSVLFGLVVGYIVALCMGMVDFSALHDVDIIALPHFMPFKIEFNANAIFSFILIFLVSATELSVIPLPLHHQDLEGMLRKKKPQVPLPVTVL